MSEVWIREASAYRHAATRLCGTGKFLEAIEQIHTVS